MHRLKDPFKHSGFISIKFSISVYCFSCDQARAAQALHRLPDALQQATTFDGALRWSATDMPGGCPHT